MDTGYIVISLFGVFAIAFILMLTYYSTLIHRMRETTKEQEAHIQFVRSENKELLKRISELEIRLFVSKPKVELKIDCETAVAQLEQISDFLRHFDYHLNHMASLIPTEDKSDAVLKEYPNTDTFDLME